jgi:hypothetical protein
LAVFEKYSHIKFNEKPGCSIWMYRQMDGQTETDRQTHIMKPIDTFCISRLYLNCKYGVKVVVANITEIMFFLTVEAVRFKPDCIARFVK